MKKVEYNEGPYIIQIEPSYRLPNSADITYTFKAYFENSNGRNFYFRTLITNKIIIIPHYAIEFMVPCKERINKYE